MATIPKSITARFQGTGFHLVRIALGVLLLIAAGLKAVDVWSGLPPSPLFPSPRWQIALIELETLFGFWLLSGVYPRGAWLAAIGLFTTLAAFSSYLGLEGQRWCKCFGDIIRVSPWLTFGLDVTAVIALLVWRPLVSSSNTPVAWLRGLLQTALGAATFLALIGGSLLVAYDDLPHALARLRNESISVDPAVSKLGEGREGEQRWITLQLTNRTDRPIRMVVARCAARRPSRSQAELGNAGREALLPVRLRGGPRSRASQACVPKQSLGTRRPCRTWGHYQRLQGHFSFTLVENGALDAKASYALKKGAGDRLSLTNIREDTTNGGVRQTTSYAQVFNPQYAFALERPRASMPWVLTALTAREERLPPFMARVDATVDFYLNCLVYIDRERLAAMASQAEFRVIGCRRIHASGDDLVSVDFGYAHEEVRRSNLVQRGTLVLDPQRFWCLRSYNARIKTLGGGQGTFKFTVVKWRDTDGFPVPISTLFETDSTEDNVRITQKWENNYDLSIPESLPPDSEFTLSAFGLPEQEGLGRRRTVPWYLWAGVLGVVSIGLAALLRWRARRSEQGGK